MLGKLGELGQELGTPNIHEAIHFKTREECEAWINGNHLWKATEHGLWLRQNAGDVPRPLGTNSRKET